MLMSQIAKLLKEALGNRPDLSFAKASKGAGLSEAYAKKIRRGHIQNPGVKTLWKIAKFLNIPTPDLITAIEADVGQTGVAEPMNTREAAWLNALRRLAPETEAQLFRTVSKAAESTADIGDEQHKTR